MVLNGFVDNDPTKTFSFRRTNGVTAHLIDVDPGEAYLRFALFDSQTDGNDDLDMYVYYCADLINCNKIGDSGEPTSQEEFNVLLPAGGRYAVLVHGFQTDQIGGGFGANYKLFGWSFGLDDDQGNMSASGPAAVTAGTTADVTIDWLGPAFSYYGSPDRDLRRGWKPLPLLGDPAVIFRASRIPNQRHPDNQHDGRQDHPVRTENFQRVTQHERVQVLHDDTDERKHKDRDCPRLAKQQ